MPEFILPGLIIDCAWPYKTQPEDIYTSPSGTRTITDSRCSPPFGLDRLCALAIAQKVRQQGQVIRGTAREITDGFGVTWSPSATMTRLRRVASCWIERPNKRGVYERLRVAERYVESGHRFELTASDEFVRDVETGMPYSLEIARRIAQRPAVLDLYLWQMAILHLSVRSYEWDPFEFLPAPRSRTKKWQLLRQRAELITQVWPACPFELGSEGRTLIHAGRKARRQREAAARNQARVPSRPEPAPLHPWMHVSEPASTTNRPADGDMFMWRPPKNTTNQPADGDMFMWRPPKNTTDQPADSDMFMWRPPAPNHPQKPPRCIVRPVMPENATDQPADSDMFMWRPSEPSHPQTRPPRTARPLTQDDLNIFPACVGQGTPGGPRERSRSIIKPAKQGRGKPKP